ncbi:MAG: choice-of-anchor L domain-containing protein [Crocinitomicaceae bacterium]|nr:choice-of-anchor L domain-containing protein [Crocinitomicaceae bacterium]
MSLRIFLVSIVSMLFGTSALSQITVDNTLTPVQIVDNLIGAGVTVSNISFTGNTNQIGSFDGSASNIGLPNGIIMSSGTILDIVPPNQPTTGTFGNPGDPDLLTVAQSVTSNPQAGLINTTFDAAILEFDFVPTGDSVQFNFVFASEEYTTYINTQFNDAFGFFISGPGFAGPFAAPAAFPMGAENLAFVPGTTDPITISTIHPGLNAAYYINNTAATHSFNGFTIPMTIEFEVTCGQTYHFKFAVADCQDDFLDTGVFLEGNSFSSDAVDVAVATVSGDTAVYEGCTFADFIFSRTDSTDTLVVTYDIAGTATDGADYTTLGTSITFLPGVDTMVVTLDPIADGIIEPGESVIITAYTVNSCGDTITSTGTVWIFDEPFLDIAEDDPILLCGDDSLLVGATASGGFAPYTYSWTGSTSVTDSAYVNASLLGPVEYYVTATDGCGYTITDTVTVTLNQTLAIDTLISIPSAPCNATGAVSAVASGVTGVPLYEWIGPGAGSPNSIDATVWENLSPGWYFFTVTDNVCEESDSVYVDVTPPPVASFDAVPQSGCAPLTVTFTNTSQNTTSYEWDFGTGSILSTTSTAPLTQTFTSTTTIQLTAYDDGGCPSDATTTITVTACGCTDPSAENYDPNAVVDDGSCFYPEPIITVPNVFTPNGDNQNDIFFISVENAEDLEFTILNRWGNVVYEATGLTAAWNGFLEGGNFAQDGTYFVKYVVTAINGDLIEGHSFVQLVDGNKP